MPGQYEASLRNDTRNLLIRRQFHPAHAAGVQLCLVTFRGRMYPFFDLERFSIQEEIESGRSGLCSLNPPRGDACRERGNPRLRS
jgi:hypothetical protein